MKFTEEQYQKIVDMFEKANDEYNMGFLNPNVVVFFQEKIFREFGKVIHLVEDWRTIVAIANPLTREWAHEQFVEKEKKYVWTSKKMSSDGTRLRLQNTGTNGVVHAYGKFKDRKADWTEHLTESEVKEWGYNPEMFDKEEVE